MIGEKIEIKIEIDKDECNHSVCDPRGCKKCPQIHPPKAFATRPSAKRDFMMIAYMWMIP